MTTFFVARKWSKLAQAGLREQRHPRGISNGALKCSIERLNNSCEGPESLQIGRGPCHMKTEIAMRFDDLSPSAEVGTLTRLLLAETADHLWHTARRSRRPYLFPRTNKTDTQKREFHYPMRQS